MTERPYHHGDLRTALLTAAEAELTDHGVEGFSLRAVAKRAGVSHAAPAHHFRDVGGLLTALCTEGFRQFNASLAAHEVGATDPTQRAIGAGFGYMNFALTRPTLFRLIFSSVRPDFADPDLSAAANEAYQNLVGLVQDLGGGTVDLAALWAMAHGLADLSAGHRLGMLADLPQDQRDAAIRDILTRALPRPRP